MNQSMNIQSKTFCSKHFGMFALLLLPASLFASATKDATVPLHERKYHIKVSIAFETNESLTSHYRAHIIKSVTDNIQRTVGEVWALQIEEDQQLLPASDIGLNRLDVELLQASLAQFESNDLLNPALLVQQCLAANHSYSELMKKFKLSKRKKPSRKISPVEKIWLSFSKELQTKILASTAKKERSSMLTSEILAELNRLLSNTEMIPRASNLSQGLLAATNRDRIIEAFPNVFSKLRYDKALFVTVQKQGVGFQLSGREWDETTRKLSKVQQTHVTSRRSLGMGITRFLTQLFHPHFEITNVDEDNITLRMQGGAYPTPDPAAQFIKPGDMLHPLFRYLDRRRIVQKVQFLSYSYLQVKDVKRNQITCLLISGVRSPLGTGRRRRVEALAVGMKLTSNKTHLKLMPRKGIQNPLVGYRVTVVNSKEKEPLDKLRPEHLISNREGEVIIRTRPHHQLLWLFIRSGEALLARVPLVPGYLKHETIPLNNDAIRLGVEGEVAILKGDLVDLVARRATLISRTRAFAKKSDWKKVDELTKELSELPRIAHFKDRLNRIQVLSLEAADKQGDRLAKSRIRRLCNDAGKLIKDFLENEKVEEFLEEMIEIRKK